MLGPGPSATSPLPDMPVLPLFAGAPGDRAGETSARDPGTGQNSNVPATLLPTDSIISTDSLPAAAADLPTTAVARDGYDDHSNGQSIHKVSWRPDRNRVLLLCGGPDDREDSLTNLFRASGLECTNYDLANGPQFDIVDDSAWDKLHTEAFSMEYVGCMAGPPCGPMSKLHSLPGPPPLFDVAGTGRYGRSNLSPRSKERARKHI